MQHEASKKLIVLSGNQPVAMWDGNILSVTNENLLPLYLKNHPYLPKWLESRAIDSSRTNSRLLKKALKISQSDDINVVLKAHAATITDNYWVKEEGSALLYKDVAISRDDYAELALRGTYDSFSKAADMPYIQSPELTNIGSFEKCWKLENGYWYLYKKATETEKISEIFIYQLGKKLNIKMAIYEDAGDCVKTKDFTEGKVNFEPAAAFVLSETDYVAQIESLQMLSINIIPAYIRMIYMDALIANPDRHLQNFGVLRDKNTGEIIELAPLFDHNMALISRGIPHNIFKDVLITDFLDVLKEYPEYINCVPHLDNSTLMSIATNYCGLYANDVYRVVSERQKIILSEINKLQPQYNAQNAQHLHEENILDEMSKIYHESYQDEGFVKTAESHGYDTQKKHNDIGHEEHDHGDDDEDPYGGPG